MYFTTSQFCVKVNASQCVPSQDINGNYIINAGCGSYFGKSVKAAEKMKMSTDVCGWRSSYICCFFFFFTTDLITSGQDSRTIKPLAKVVWDTFDHILTTSPAGNITGIYIINAGCGGCSVKWLKMEMSTDVHGWSNMNR